MFNVVSSVVIFSLVAKIFLKSTVSFPFSRVYALSLVATMSRKWNRRHPADIRFRPMQLDSMRHMRTTHDFYMAHWQSLWKSEEVSR